MHGYTFDQCWKSIPDGDGHTSTTDRGWMYLGDVTYGNYLDYEHTEHYAVKDGPTVHAVVFDRHEDSMWSDSVNHRYKWCHTVLEAQEWMITEKTGQLSLYVNSKV
jgi:hypothetical protein